MAYHPRIESKDLTSFLTTRSRNSELWFVNNRPLEEAILGYTAKFAERYDVKLFAISIEGNHVQGPARFPNENRANFMRDLNACIARAVPRYCPEYRGGGFWAKRYSSEFLPGPEDIEKYFFYTVLQPVNDGLVEKISDYPGYNCFHDAVNGVKRKFKVVRWGDYHADKRHDPKISIKDYTDIVQLEFERLPGYEHLSQHAYAKLMNEKLEQRRLEVIEKRRSAGLGFMGPDAVRKVKPGSLPYNTKTSTSTSHRPRILSVCPKRRAEYSAWYFKLYFDYKEASQRYRDGELDVTFPPGTYRPYCPYHPPNQICVNY